MIEAIYLTMFLGACTWVADKGIIWAMTRYM